MPTTPGIRLLKGTSSWQRPLSPQLLKLAFPWHRIANVRLTSSPASSVMIAPWTPHARAGTPEKSLLPFPVLLQPRGDRYRPTELLLPPAAREQGHICRQ